VTDFEALVNELVDKRLAEREAERQTVWMTVQQAAEYISVSPKTIRRYIDSGRIVASQPVREWRIDRASLDKLLRTDWKRQASNRNRPSTSEDDIRRIAGRIK